MREAVIVSAVRSPVGKFRGGLSPLKPHELAAVVVKEAVSRSRIDPALVDEVMFGCVMGKEYNNVARVVALASGLPVGTPAISFDRQCGTSLNAVAYASALIEGGMYGAIVAGGVEMDTRRPWLLARTEQAFQAAPPEFLHPTVTPPEYGNAGMVQTAENVARKYGVTRTDCDAYAVESHRRAIAAWDAGYFGSQILPVVVPAGKGASATVCRDETMRQSDLATMGSLRVASGLADGVVTAGNSSPNCDGASALVVMEKDMAEAYGAAILGACRGFVSVGVEPDYMGMGPVTAIGKLLKAKGMTLSDIGVVEINEAFASQTIACSRELGIDPAKLNPNGGAIALGHPLAATGGILIAKTLAELERRGEEFGLISFCVGGGQGVALLVQRL
ncbi:MAG TPA: acetyl-CoA C-acyltransferase [Treponema sp.]|nr:MAG: acetyl-CoA acetyltransferase [Treponema sp. GWC1_61_84]HCM25312.1 acetyl-CoA C-acyltransferase [Treponema sp.]